MRIAVTGAFGYSGRYMASRLLEAGHELITLTNSAGRTNPFGERIRAYPFHFDAPDRLRATLCGIEVLVNTYWVRFDHRTFNHTQAVANTRVMFEAARAAGVRRIIHVSITNPDASSGLNYFRGKAELESALKMLGVSYAILRPTVLFGKEDVLINNIAWSLRHLPVFGVFGSGDYRLQPIYVDDLAAEVVEQSVSSENVTRDAIGPETFTYRELVQLVRDQLGLRTPILGIPPGAGYWCTRILGWFLRDMIITRDEIQGLMEGRLFVEAPPMGSTKLSDWVREHCDTLGRRYTSEMSRRLNRSAAYLSN